MNIQSNEHFIYLRFDLLELLLGYGQFQPGQGQWHYRRFIGFPTDFNMNEQQFSNTFMEWNAKT